MRSPLNPSDSIPTVRLMSERTQPQTQSQPLEIGNFREQRIEQFLALKNLSANSKRNYQRQLRTFIQFVDRDWQAVTMNDVRRYKEYLEQERGLKPASVGTAIAAIKSLWRKAPLKPYRFPSPRRRKGRICSRFR